MKCTSATLVPFRTRYHGSLMNGPIGRSSRRTILAHEVLVEATQGLRSSHIPVAWALLLATVISPAVFSLGSFEVEGVELFLRL